MAIINSCYGFVFIAEPHTGSRAIRDTLQQLEGSEETNGDHHMTLFDCQNKGYLTRTQARNYLVFSAIRNPYDLLITRWWFHARNSFTFKEYVMDIGWEQEQNGTLFWRSQADVDYHIRHEHLEIGLNNLLRGLGCEEVSLPVIGETIGKSDWISWWYPELDYAARDRYHDIYNYSYETIYDGLDCLGIKSISEPLVKMK